MGVEARGWFPLDWVKRMTEADLLSLLEQYTKRLQDSLNPSFVEVVDDSAAHAGHEGAKSAVPISHMTVRICASALQDLSPVQRHQKIYALFEAELKSGDIHALRIDVMDRPPGVGVSS